MGYAKYEMIDMKMSPEASTDHDAKSLPMASSTAAATDLKYSDGPVTEISNTTLLGTESAVNHRAYRNHPETIRDRILNRGWRGGLIRWTILSTTIWLITIITYVCLVVTTRIRSGSGTIMTATCSKVSVANTLIHLALNVVSSLMLSASTYAQESLCAPTRAEVNAAHARGHWLGIGGLSIRKFRFISKTRSALWVLLSITSIPLHLFFNAVFFTSSQTHQYAVAVVNTKFFDDSTFVANSSIVDPSNYADLGGYSKEYLYARPNNEVLVDLLNDAMRNNATRNLTVLDRAQCISTYATGFMQDASDVVVVVDNNTSNDLIWTRYPERSISPTTDSTNGDSFNWICHDELDTKMEFGGKVRDRCSPEVIKFITENGNWTVYGSPVQSCLSRSYTPTCHLLFNSWLMAAVLVIGIIKTSILVYIILRLSRQHNLRTFGDAVASFLRDEDQTTKNLCLVPSKVFVKHGLVEQPPQLYDGKPERWWRSAGMKQFVITLVITLFCAILLGVALSFAIEGAYGSAFDVSFGQANIQSLFSVQRDDVGSSGIVPNLITANIPQVVFSLLYMTYNDIFSKMLMGHEFDKFTRRRGPLRVSERTQGLQRGTRYFSLPMRWAFPLMGLGALLHWLASQAMFAVRVDGVDNNDVIDPEDQLSRLGYNSRAITALVVVLVFVALGLVYIGFLNKFDTSLGEMGNSLVVSAACHPPHSEENASLHLGEVSWGDVTGHSADVRHCSFSDRDPVRPMKGAYYA